MSLKFKSVFIYSNTSRYFTTCEYERRASFAHKPITARPVNHLFPLLQYIIMPARHLEGVLQITLHQAFNWLTIIIGISNVILRDGMVQKGTASSSRYHSMYFCWAKAVKYTTVLISINRVVLAIGIKELLWVSFFLTAAYFRSVFGYFQPHHTVPLNNNCICLHSHIDRGYWGCLAQFFPNPNDDALWGIYNIFFAWRVRSGCTT